jgi:hypothetical protein
MTQIPVQIPDDWLKVAGKGTLFYPAAGQDWVEPVTILKGHVKSFMFCDLKYPQGMKLEDISSRIVGLELLKSTLDGAPDCELLHNGKYRNIDPSWLQEAYRDSATGNEFTVTRRRGFGQYGLLEQADKTISVFMHRGDTLANGESSSGLHLWQNQSSSWKPLSNLLDKILERLCDKCLVITDGSNSRISFMTQWHRKNDSLDPEMWLEECAKTHSFKGFLWRLVGRLENRYGPTLVWGLERA